VTGWLQRLAEKAADLSAWQASREPSDNLAPALPVLETDVISLKTYPGGILWVSMEDRQAKNMFSDAFMAGMNEVFAAIAGREDYKVVILTGYDTYFASGGTKESLVAIQEGRARFTDVKVYELAMRCPIPVIAAMQGHGIGAGWALGMFADFVYFSEESRYVSPYMNYGFTPGAGSTFVFPHRVGYDLARETLFSGREYSGKSLKERGLNKAVINRAQLSASVLSLAQAISQHSRASLVTLKRSWTSEVRAAIEMTYAQELLMHEKTFVGRTDTLQQIEKEFLTELSVAGSVAAMDNLPTEEVPDSDVGATETASPSPMTETAPGVSLGSVTDRLRVLLAEELHMDADEIDGDEQFVDLGLDSITGVTWIRKINEAYGLKLEATRVYSYPTLGQMSRHVREEAEKQGTLAKAVAPTAAAAPAKPAVAPPALKKQSQPLPQAPRVLARSTGSAERVLASLRQQSTGKTTRAIAVSKGTEPIAVIGIAGQFPMAQDVAGYWKNLAEGRNCISEVPAERWDMDALYEAGDVQPGKTNSKWLGLLSGYDQFDPLFFSIAPTEAETMDPQQRLFLQTAWHCIEDAGYSATALSGSRCGVFVGCATGDYHLLSREQQTSAQGFIGGAASILAARASYYLNLQGPCLSIDTACSSSLVAVASACESLNAGTSDLALAGGVYVMSTPDMLVKTAQAGMLSPDGKCYTFDQRANGFVAGEAVGVILLKRLSDALRDGDIIQGVIEGWGVNQDGKTNGITAPNAESQTRLMRDVYDRFGINPRDIQCIEAHGTGTKLGDPIEIEGLKGTFGSASDTQAWCALGSAKSNIGHCLTAAGIAGVIKLILSLKHRQIPPSIHFEQLNEHIGLSGSPFYVNNQLSSWEAPNGQRRGAVSSFGFSGTNAHLVIREAPAMRSRNSEIQVRTESGRMMVPLSAKTPEQLQEKVSMLQGFLKEQGDALHLEDVSYTLQQGRDEMDERLGIMAGSISELRERLEQILAGEKFPEGCVQGQVKKHKEGLKLLSQDEEMRETLVAKLLSGNRLTKLMDLWVKGLAIDWNRLYGEVKPQRIELPVYPFAKERYWIPNALKFTGANTSVVTDKLHQLIHRNLSDLFQVQYETSFNGQESFLKDHRIRFDADTWYPVLPGMAYLEMAREAAVIASGTSASSTSFELKDVTWIAPLIVASPSLVHTKLYPQENNVIKFEISAIEKPTNQLLCIGEIEIFDQFSTLGKTTFSPHLIDTSQLLIGTEPLYKALHDGGLDYGPSHQGIVELYRSGSTIIAKLNLSAVYDYGYVLNPGLLDSALQATYGYLVSNQSMQNPGIP
jgi:acyl transferase domain-containing protein/enoyl-CoA hydratase/carnithine racemase/acyl carrier protein